MPNNTRQGRYEAILATYLDCLAHGHNPGHVAEERYCLIERSRFDGTFHITQHRTTEKAGEYQVGKGIPEDWAIAELVDLDTGDRYDGRYRVGWQRLPHPAPGSEQPVGHVVDDEASGRIDELFRDDMYDGDDEAAPT